MNQENNEFIVVGDITKFYNLFPGDIFLYGYFIYIKIIDIEDIFEPYNAICLSEQTEVFGKYCHIGKNEDVRYIGNAANLTIFYKLSDYQLLPKVQVGTLKFGDLFNINNSIFCMKISITDNSYYTNFKRIQCLCIKMQNKDLYGFSEGDTIRLFDSANVAYIGNILDMIKRSK